MTGKKARKIRMIAEKIERREQWILEASALLSRILSGEQVQMYTIGGRSLQNYQLSPTALKEMIEQWEDEILGLEAEKDGCARRKAWSMVTTE